MIAVPTSVGYGASFGGIAALLGMLNSCANGVSVVNIDNGFGAGCIASMINQMTQLPQHHAYVVWRINICRETHAHERISLLMSSLWASSV